MTDLPWPVRIADGCATDAALAHAAALGLREIVDRFRFADPGDPIPAPGVADLPDRIHAHALDAIHAAATAHILVAGGGDPDDGAALDQAVGRAREAGLAAQRCLRRLAQIGLGVAQHSYDGDDVELVERTMLGVLSHDLDDTTAAEDAFPIVGRTRDEVSVELAGLIARLLCEVAPPGFALAADGLDPITVRITADRGIAVDEQEYPEPVTITEVTTTILRRIAAVDPAAVGRLTLEWGSG